MQTYSFGKIGSDERKEARALTAAAAVVKLTRKGWHQLDGFLVQCVAFVDMDMSGCDLRGVEFDGCGFYRCNLRDAILSGATFTGGTKFEDCAPPFRGPVMQLPFLDGWRSCAFTSDGETFIRVGCRRFTLGQARTYWRGKPDRTQMLAACDMVEREGRARGWAMKDVKAAPVGRRAARKAAPKRKTAPKRKAAPKRRR